MVKSKTNKVLLLGGITSIVVVLAATSDMCNIRKPITLRENVKFRTVRNEQLKLEINVKIFLTIERNCHLCTY